MDIPTLPNFLFEPNLAGILSLVVTFVLPYLAALLSRQSWPASAKGMILLGLATAKAVVEAAIAGGANFNLWTTLYTAAINFTIALAAYFGFQRSGKLNQRAQNSGVTDEAPGR